MSSGANIGDGGPDGIGDDPTDLGAWEKFQLGWLGRRRAAKGPFYDVASRADVEHTLGPTTRRHEPTGCRPCSRCCRTRGPARLGAPYAGSRCSGRRRATTSTHDDQDRRVSGTALTAQVNYEIEEDWDYAFLEASTDGGTTWTPVVDQPLGHRATTRAASTPAAPASPGAPTAGRR